MTELRCVAINKTNHRLQNTLNNIMHILTLSFLQIQTSTLTHTYIHVHTHTLTH